VQGLTLVTRLMQPGGVIGVLHSVGALLVQQWYSDGAVLVQYWCSDGAVLVQSWRSPGALPWHLTMLDQLALSYWKLPGRWSCRRPAELLRRRGVHLEHRDTDSAASHAMVQRQVPVSVLMGAIQYL
jgi:hypothetical protein